MRESIQFSPAEDLSFETVLQELNRFKRLLHNNQSAAFGVDLSQVSHCDSAGLALLIEIKRLCAIKKNKLMMQNVPNQLLDLAEFCGVKQLLLGVLADG
jgi:phospholipid transport system transporter-binding protein